MSVVCPIESELLVEFDLLVVVVDESIGPFVLDHSFRRSSAVRCSRLPREESWLSRSGDHSNLSLVSCSIDQFIVSLCPLEDRHHSSCRSSTFAFCNDGIQPELRSQSDLDTVECQSQSCSSDGQHVLSLLVDGSLLENDSRFAEVRSMFQAEQRSHRRMFRGADCSRTIEVQRHSRR